MAGICRFLNPVLEIESRINKKITFQPEKEGKPAKFGTYRLPDMEANKKINVDKSKIKACCLKHLNILRIQVLLDGNPTGLYLEQIELLHYARIVFEFKTKDGSRFLVAGGLEVPCGCVVQLRGLGGVTQRKRKYGNKEKKQGLKFIDGVPLEMEGTGEDKEAPNHMTASHVGDCDCSSQEIANFLHYAPQLENIVVADHLGSVCEEPLVADEKARSDYESLEYHKPSIIDGRKVAKISASDVQPEIKQWEHAIVGYVVGEDAENHSVECYVREQWRDFGPFKTYVLKPGFFLFNFTNGVDKSKVLEQRQWFINDKPFILKSWKPNLQLDPSLFLATVPIWVRFPCLSLQFFSPAALAKISSFIGEPLLVDEPTAKKERLQYARVCIEIELGNELPDTIPICVDDNNETIIEQAVEYEWKPCCYCFSLFHDSFECPLTSKFDASQKEDTDMIDLFSEDERQTSEKPGWANNDDNGQNGKSEVVNDNSSADDIFSALRQVDSQKFNASSPLVTPAIANGTRIEMSEDEEDYSPTASLLSSDQNATVNWFSYYNKLKDIGFTVRTRFLR